MCSTTLSHQIGQLNFEFWLIRSQNSKFKLTPQFFYLFVMENNLHSFLILGIFFVCREKSTILLTGGSIYVCIQYICTLVLVDSISRSQQMHTLCVSIIHVRVTFKNIQFQDDIHTCTLNSNWVKFNL